MKKKRIAALYTLALLLAVACLGNGLHTMALNRTPRLIIEDEKYGITIDRHTDVNALRDAYSNTHHLTTNEVIYTGTLVDTFYLPDPEFGTIYNEKTEVYYTIDGTVKSMEIWGNSTNDKINVNGIFLSSSEEDVIRLLGDSYVRTRSMDGATWSLSYHFGYESICFGFQEGREDIFLISVDYRPIGT